MTQSDLPATPSPAPPCADCITSPGAAETRRKRATSTKTSSACRWCTWSRKSACRRPANTAPSCICSSNSPTTRTSPSSTWATTASASPTRHAALGQSLRHGSRDEAALETMRRRLTGHGIETVGPTDHHFIRSIYFFDPNGLRLEITVRLPMHDYVADKRRAARRAGRLDPRQGRRPAPAKAAPAARRARPADPCFVLHKEIP